VELLDCLRLTPLVAPLAACDQVCRVVRATHALWDHVVQVDVLGLGSVEIVTAVLAGEAVPNVDGQPQPLGDSTAHVFA